MVGQGHSSKVERSSPKSVEIHYEKFDYTNSVRTIQCGISHSVAIVSSINGMNIFKSSNSRQWKSFLLGFWISPATGIIECKIIWYQL